MSKAIGLIETKGLVAAVEALDAALKAANVTLLNKELTDGGWVMISITGDVGSVKAAIDAGSAAAERLGQLISSHVIPRLSNEVLGIVQDSVAKVVPQKVEEKKIEIVSEPLCNEEVTVTIFNDVEKLDQMKVVELRQLARELNLDTIDRGLIKFANKEELIKAIQEHLQGGNQ